MSGLPYTKAELKRVRDAVKTKHDVVERMVVEAANDYLRYISFSNGLRPNPAREIAGFKKALQSMVAAMNDLSTRSVAILDAARRAPGGLDATGVDPMDCAALNNAIHRFLIENAVGLGTDVDEGARAGRPRINAKRHLLDRLDRAFLIGHGGIPPARGRPTFLRLCVAPKALKLSDAGGDWWEDLHRNNRGQKPST
jgi:hypothetical protein